MTFISEKGVHGKPSTYGNHKCRCTPCVTAWNKDCADRKRARRNKPLPEGKEHGNPRSYQWGCRCVSCTRAHSEYCQEKLLLKRGVDRKALLEKQGGKCACCGKTPRRLVMDHVHGTDLVRGLLCDSCNTGIGKLGDDLEGVMRAVAYLQQFVK